MPSATDVILKHIDAVNAHDNDAEPWAADAELGGIGETRVYSCASTASGVAFGHREEGRT
jgi:hypothetical protein